MEQEKVKLLASDMTELLEITPEQATILQERNLADAIPSFKELILRLKSAKDRGQWPLAMMPDELLSKIKDTMEALNTIEAKERMSFEPPLTGDILAEAFTKIEVKNERVIAVVMAPFRYKDFRKWGRDVIDPVCNPVLLKKGIISILWRAPVIVTKSLTYYDVLLIGDGFYTVGLKNHKK